MVDTARRNMAYRCDEDTRDSHESPVRLTSAAASSLIVENVCERIYVIFSLPFHAVFDTFVVHLQTQGLATNATMSEPE